MDYSNEVAAERIQRAAAVLMAQNINAELVIQQAKWEVRDADFYAAMGRPDPGFTLEPVLPENVHSGTIPSLLRSPRSAFPNCCTIAYAGQPVRTGSDFAELYVIVLNIEFMVSSADEEECNARIQRTLEAGHSVLLSDKARRLPEPGGGNLVSPIQSTPAYSVSELFVRHENQDPNKRFFWQGGTLSYTVEKVASY